MIVTFSRGFQLPKGELNYGSDFNGKHVLKAGDVRTNELYNKLRNSQMRDMPFGLATAIIGHASATFGDMTEWFKHNLHQNTHISGSRAGYLVDTMGFVLTGKRCFDNELWLNMILDEGDPNATSRFKIDRILYESFFKLSSTSMFQNWISHPEGICDLAQFMYVCFGAEVYLPSHDPAIT